MENAPRCTARDHGALVAYLYDECDPVERAQVEAHLAVCVRCADEAASFRSVRGALGAWESPQPALGFRVVSDRDRTAASWRRLAPRPGWGLAAAAGMVLAAGVLLGGVEVRYGDDVFVFRAGLVDYVRSLAAPSAPAPPGAGDRTAAASAGPAAAERPWRADLAALGNQLRRELAPAAGGPGRASPLALGPETRLAGDRDALLRQVRGLIAQSERRQQQERALWLTEFAQELDVQRSADQQRLQQELGALDGVADYLVRVSQP